MAVYENYKHSPDYIYPTNVFLCQTGYINHGELLIFAIDSFIWNQACDILSPADCYNPFIGQISADKHGSDVNILHHTT